MLKGIDLTLMIGPVLPVVTPKSVVDALTSVQVTSGKDQSGFQLTFAMSKDSPLQTMLAAGFFDPMTTRVIIIVTLRGFPHVLMDGIITRHELTPSSEPGQSTLTLTGEDLSVLMDVVEVTRPFPAMFEIAQLYVAMAPYLVFGIVPALIPPIISIMHTPMDQIEAQVHETDRAFMRRVAGECGYVFYIEPGPVPGASIAYFGPDIRLPIPQPALSINMDAHTNVESLSFSLDGLAKKVKVKVIYDPITKKIPIPIPIPNVNIFKPPLGARLTPPSRILFSSDDAKRKPTDAAKRILSFMMSGSDAISASGSLDVLRYGHVLRSRMLVGVRGAGMAYDGMYYVNSVTHNIKRGEYKINFTLSRDGLISLTPRVVT
jgi:hypothetical protein